MKKQKKKWIKPELIVFAKGKLGENVLTYCGYQDPRTGIVTLRSGTT